MNPDTQTYWDGEFDSFFNAETGVNIDALWIDMNGELVARSAWCRVIPTANILCRSE